MSIVRLVRRTPPSYSLYLAGSVLDHLDPDIRQGLGQVFEVGLATGAEAEAALAQDVTAVIANRGMPPETWERYARIPELRGDGFAEAWRPYTVDATGLVLLPAPETTIAAGRRALRPGKNAPPIPSYPFPYWRVHLQAHDEARQLVAKTTIVIQLWQRILRCEGTPLTVVHHWSPAGNSVAIHGLEQIPPRRYRADLQRLLAGMPMLQLKDDIGRPPGRLLGRDDFAATLREQYQAWLDDHGKRPTQTDIAAELYISRSTLRRLLTDHNIQWPPIS